MSVSYYWLLFHIATGRVSFCTDAIRYSYTINVENSPFCGIPFLIPSCRLKSHLYSVQPSVIFFFDMYFLWILRFIVFVLFCFVHVIFYFYVLYVCVWGVRLQACPSVQPCLWTKLIINKLRVCTARACKCNYVYR